KITKQSFENWLRPTKLVSFDDNEIVIEVPNRHFVEWITKNYLAVIQDTLKRIHSEEVAVSFIVGDGDKDEMVKETPAAAEPAKITPRGESSRNFHPKYTFDKFIVGENNKFAHAVCLAVSKDPAQTYNPLFIFGGVGLGKTHLMHAIGNHLQDNRKELKVIYVSSEQYTNEFIEGIHSSIKMNQFKNKYRNADVLLVDDIQFLAEKYGLQEAFFHTFNSLYEKHKQIVISSDRPAREIPSLEDRLRSRFEMGLIADIQPPNFETRVAIIRKKADEMNVALPSEVAFYIAEKIKDNVRELEGALNRIIAYSSITGKTIDRPLAEEILRKILIFDGPKTVSVDEIQTKVADYFKISISDMKKKRKTKDIVVPRMVAMYLSRELTSLSLPLIGKMFGGRDHTTVLHACREIKEQITKDEALNSSVSVLIKELQKRN
ncbi:MAG: chromosomal replication initiation protein DnaA, partial [Lentisphaerae bacterium GWF2_52_8]